MSKYTINSATTAEVESDIGMSSDVHDATITMAYITKSKGGALGLVIEAACTKGFHKETLWFVTGDEKENKTYFIDRSGAQKHLPGYVCFHALLALTGSSATPEQILENGLKTKVANVYDFDVKEVVPTDVDAVVDLIEKTVKLGLIEEIQDKYNAPGETVTKFVLDKVFNTKGFTTSEVTAKLDAPDHINKWLKKNKDTVKNRVKGGDAKGGAAKGAPAAATMPAKVDSIFNEDDD